MSRRTRPKTTGDTNNVVTECANKVPLERYDKNRSGGVAVKPLTGINMLESGIPEETKKLEEILEKEREVKILRRALLTITMYGVGRPCVAAKEILRRLFLEKVELHWNEWE